MSDQYPPDWSETIAEVVEGWFFDDLAGATLPRAAVLPLENPELFDEAVIARHVKVLSEHRGVLVGEVDGQPVCVLRSKLGAPAVGMVVPSARRVGVEVVIGVGFCGGIDASLRCGDTVVPVGAVATDGVSRASAPPGYPAVAAPDLGAHLAAAVGAASRGLTWSMDAVLLQSSAATAQWADLGVVAVDMEVGALLTVARLRGVRAAAVLTVSDSPRTGARTDGSALAMGYERAFAGAVAVAAGAS